ncbi:MAG TPA: hypothetical protein DEP05_04110 [Betaproteobacteria bacterium]|nr:hypothetical protein [Betaproteobacteria bacterium]
MKDSDWHRLFIRRYLFVNSRRSRKQRATKPRRMRHNTTTAIPANVKIRPGRRAPEERIAALGR